MSTGVSQPAGNRLRQLRARLGPARDWKDKTRGWLDRVRDGLEPAEAALTLRRVYQVWILALLLKALGAGWDVAWHFKWLRDDFAPPHLVNLAGDGIMLLLVLFHFYTRFGVDRLALRLMATGTAVFILSAPVDVLNHKINGLDITAWSVTHFGLFVGTAIAIAGVIRGWGLHSAAQPQRLLMLGLYWFFFLDNVLFPNQQQEYGILSIRAWERGAPYAEPSLLAFAAKQIGRPVDTAAVLHFALPIPSWVYPLWITVAGGLVLVLARRHLGWRWTATALAAAYVTWRCVLWPILVVATFPPSTVPFLVIGAGFAVDLAYLAAAAWPVQALLGGVLVTASVYLGGYLQSTVNAAPPIAYRSAPVAGIVLIIGWAALGFLLGRTAERAPATALSPPVDDRGPPGPSPAR